MERLKAFEIFKSIANCGSLTKAAAEFGLPRSSVSRALQELETWLRVQLFHRTTRKVTLTLVGRTVLEHVTGILTCYDDLATISHRNMVEAYGEIRVDISSSFGLHRLSPVLAVFAIAYPQVRVDLRIVDVKDELLTDAADLGICVARAIPASYIARPLEMTRLGLYASPSLLRRIGIPRHPAELDAGECMALEHGRGAIPWILTHSETGDQSIVAARGPLCSNSADALISAAIQGMGVALVPQESVRLPVSSGELVQILGKWNAPPLDTRLVYRSRRNQPMSVRKLIAHLVDNFGAERTDQATCVNDVPMIDVRLAPIGRRDHALLATEGAR